MGRPSQVALPMRSPPTSLETQVSVTSRSTSGPREQGREVEPHLAVDQSVDAQLPVLRADAGHDERGVDPVEVAGGDPERRDTGDPDLDAGGQGGLGIGGGGQPDAGPGGLGAPGCPSRGSRPAASATAPEPATTPTVGAASRRSGPTPGRFAISSRSTRAGSASPPTMAATALGSTETIVASGRVTAAIPATVASASTTHGPRNRPRAATIPASALSTASTAAAPTRSTSLSDVPKVEVAKSLSHGGVRSTKASPTATRGSDDGPVRAATISAAPTASSPAASPASAATPRESVVCCGGAGAAVVVMSSACAFDVGDAPYETPTSASTRSTTGASARKARPRWLTASFSSGPYSARVRVPPSGTKIGS